jgi:hypothetical protein
MPIDDYFRNLDFIKRKLIKIILSVEKFLEEEKEIIAIIRVLMIKNKPILAKIFSKFLHSKSLTQSIVLIDKEKNILDKELSISIRELKEKIKIVI